jgi:hypothetical protein
MLKFIEKCRQSMSLCYQSSNDIDHVLGYVVFKTLFFFYFYFKQYFPSTVDKVAKELVAAGRLTDFKKAKDDIFKWYTFYHYAPWEYAAYHFETKSKEERLKFYSDINRMKFGSIVNNITDWNKLDNKLKAYELYKDAFRRDVLSIKDESDFPAFEKFCENKPAFFAKPLSGSLGRNSDLIKLDPEKDLRVIFDDLLKIGPYILEDPIRQCPELASLNPDSVNTVRIATLLSKDCKNVDILFSYVRCGRKGITVDNSGAGGYLASIDPETGTVITDGCAKDGTFEQIHPDTGVTFKGFTVPRYEEAKALVADLAKRLPSIRYVGWDLSVTEDAVVLVEANSFAQMSGCQFSTGIGKAEYFENFLRAKK